MVNVLNSTQKSQVTNSFIVMAGQMGASGFQNFENVVANVIYNNMNEFYTNQVSDSHFKRVKIDSKYFLNFLWGSGTFRSFEKALSHKILGILDLIISFF